MKALILVGGFGACNYLYDQLSEEHHSDGIMVLQPRRDGPWTAIVRGAVIRAASTGTSNIVQSRVSRFSYGIAGSPVFDKNLHDNRDRYFDKFYDCHRARNQMDWYVTKGQDISVLNPVSVKYSHPHDTPLANDAFNFEIMFCEEEEPPKRAAEPSVTALCDISCNLDVHFNELPVSKNSKGLEFRVMVFDVRMLSEDASLQFGVYVKGRKQGHQNVQVQFQNGIHGKTLPALGGLKI